MTLTDDLIDEHSRHVLVPEIGPAGLQRLLGTRVALVGTSPTCPLLHELLERSGLHVVEHGGDAAIFLGRRPDADAPCPSLVGWGDDDVVHVATIGGRPCPACIELPHTPMPTSPLAVQSLAALAATTLVLRLVTPDAGATDVRLDLAVGSLETRPLAGGGCRRCVEGIGR